MNVDVVQILTHAVGFLILLAILKRFAWGKLLEALEARRTRIAEELKTIEETKGDLAKLKSQYQESLNKIEEEARGKIQQAAAQGRSIAVEIEEDARAHAQQTLEKAKEAIQLEVAKARTELKEQVADLAIQITHKILKEHLDEETDRRMIEAFIREINTLEGGPASPPSSQGGAGRG